MTQGRSIAVAVTESPAPLVRVAQANLDDLGRPEVSIVIVAFGTDAILIDSVRSIAATTETQSVEVVVVSNPHPRRGQRSAIDLHLFTAGVRVVEPDANLGFGGGCEIGAIVARGDVLAFVNPDVEAQPGWLAPLIDAVHRADRPTIAAPVLLNPDGTVQEAGQRIRSNARTDPITSRPAPGSIVDVDYASAACWVIRRDHHELLGGFDPDFHPAYFEDVDLALRARAKGGRCVVVADSSVRHHAGHGTPDRPTAADRQRDLLTRRWPSLRWNAGPDQPSPNSASMTRLA